MAELLMLKCYAFSKFYEHPMFYELTNYPFKVLLYQAKYTIASSKNWTKSLLSNVSAVPFIAKMQSSDIITQKLILNVWGFDSINWVGCFASPSIKPIFMRRISELIEVNNGKTSIPYSAGNSECSRWLVFHTCGIVVLISSWQFIWSSF